MPAEWLSDVREADEDGLLPWPSTSRRSCRSHSGACHGRHTAVAKPAARRAPLAPFTHPDAQRRFRVVTSVEELERALDAPWDKWAVFLHPEQRQLVTRPYAGPARVAGSAGTGKTVVALHRAVHLARANPDGRILLATFSEPLAHALRANVKRLIGNEPRVAERLEVHSMSNLGLRLHQAQLGPVRLASTEDVDALLARGVAGRRRSQVPGAFLRTEWDQVVDAWQLGTWEAYRDVQRLGRRTRLPEARRAVLWTIFEQVREGLKTRGLMTESAVFQALADAQAKRRRPTTLRSSTRRRTSASRNCASSRHSPVDGPTDSSSPATSDSASSSSLLLEGARRGRSRPIKTLRVNYRTSHQIREQADRLLGPELTDVDGNREERRHTVSVFNGPAPEIRTFSTETRNAEPSAPGCALAAMVCSRTRSACS